jgi:hypothetical protein
MDTNQSGDLYQKDTVCPETVENWKNTIYSYDVQADGLSEQEDWGIKELLKYI